MNTPTPEDFAAMRAEGSLEEFIDLLTGNRPGSKPAAIAVPEPEPRLPRAGPGAWPTGTSPPGPVAPLPAAVSEAALAEYRQWYLAGRPPCDTRCDCGGCTPGGT